jgi:hypothetical protein
MTLKEAWTLIMLPVRAEAEAAATRYYEFCSALADEVNKIAGNPNSSQDLELWTLATYRSHNPAASIGGGAGLIPEECRPRSIRGDYEFHLIASTLAELAEGVNATPTLAGQIEAFSRFSTRFTGAFRQQNLLHTVNLPQGHRLAAACLPGKLVSVPSMRTIKALHNLLMKKGWITPSPLLAANPSAAWFVMSRTIMLSLITAVPHESVYVLSSNAWRLGQLATR